jgi:ATP-binding cassette subfamily F protein 3
MTRRGGGSTVQRVVLASDVHEEHHAEHAHGHTGRGEDERDRKPKSASRSDVRRAAAQLRTELAPLRRRIADAEKTVARLNKDITGIDAALADAGLFARDPAKAAQLSKDRANAVNALARAEDEWLTASEALEAAMRGADVD